MAKANWLLWLVMSVGSVAMPAVQRLALCPQRCSAVCRSIASDLDLEIQVQTPFVVVGCKDSASAAGQIVISNAQDAEREVQLTLKRGHEVLLQKGYAIDKDRSAAIRRMIADVSKGVAKKPNPEPIVKVLPSPPVKVVVANAPEPIKSPEPPAAEEKVVEALPPPSLPEEQAPVMATVVHMAEPVLALRPRGYVSGNLAGENWSYRLDAEGAPPVHSKVVPKLQVEATLCPLWPLRLTFFQAGSIMDFRLRTNYAIDGDGQLVMAYVVQSQFNLGALFEIYPGVEAGLESGYVFWGTFVDAQRFMHKVVTVVPGFKMHALYVGANVILGAQSDLGLLELGVGALPLMSYEERPDSPGSEQSAFGMSARALARMKFTPSWFAEAGIRTLAVFGRYEGEGTRESIRGTLFRGGNGHNLSLSASLGLGWNY